MVAVKTFDGLVVIYHLYGTCILVYIDTSPDCCISESFDADSFWYLVRVHVRTCE